MKILQISDSIQNIGGAEKTMYDIKSNLDKKNHQVFLWGTQTKQINQSVFSIFNLKYFIQLYKYLKNHTDFDVIHLHKFNSILSPSIFLAIKGKGKIILHIHDFSFYCPKLGVTQNGEECRGGIFHFHCNRFIERGVLGNTIFDFIKWLKFIINRYFIKKYVEIFLCPSKKLQEYMIQSLQLPKEKVLYLPNFIEIEENHQPNLKKINDTNFLFVGRLSKEKGVEIAVKAFDILVNKEGIKDIYFEIIGDGIEKNNLENLVKSLGLENNIKFLGKINNKELQKYYEVSIGLIIPSICLENNPLVAIEGMKHGKTIIASHIGGLSDLIECKKNGYLFKVGNYIELAEKIKQLYKNQVVSMEMGKHGFEKLKKEFNSEIFYKKLIKIYNEK